MTAEQLLRHLAEVTFIVIWAAILMRSVRQPRPATIHAAIFFGLAVATALLDWAGRLIGPGYPALAMQARAAMFVTMPYLLLLLADDFAGVPQSTRYGMGLALIAAVVSSFTVRPPFPIAYQLLTVTYSVAILAYSTARFLIAARAASGASRRRMEAVAVAGSLFALTFVFDGVGSAIPGQDATWASLSSGASFGYAVAYFVGFLPPRFFRQAWQAPQVQQFLISSTLAPRNSLLELTTAIERDIVPMLGAQQANIAIWDEPTQRLVSPQFVGVPLLTVIRESALASQVFDSQVAIFVENAERSDPVNAEVYRQFKVRSMMMSPVTVDEHRLGMLTIFGKRPPLFAEDDLDIARLLARQIAVLLRDFEMTNELTEFRAHQEAARLKDDFLSAAAHDLKTPLTTLLAQSQLMRRRALRDPERPADLEGIEQMVREAERMRRLVDDLLDAARGDQIGFVGRLEAVDLCTLVSEVIAGVSSEPTIHFTGTPVTVLVDTERIRQAVSNLLDNAIKYSPNGGDIDVALTAEEGFAILRVTDRGIGIAAGDLPVIFERFRRAVGVQHVSMTGLGLGLYFCKRIVEEHGGQIAVRSVVSQGSEFEIRLPLPPPEVQS